MTSIVGDVIPVKIRDEKRDVYFSAIRDGNRKTFRAASRDDRRDVYHAAARDGNMEVLRYGTRKDYELEDEDGMTATLWTAYCGHLEALKLLVERGANIHKSDQRGNSALHHATSNCHVTCVIFLTTFGVNLWALNNNYNTALDVAIFSNQSELVKYLQNATDQQMMLSVSAAKKCRASALLEAQRRIRKQDKEINGNNLHAGRRSDSRTSLTSLTRSKVKSDSCSCQGQSPTRSRSVTGTQRSYDGLTYNSYSISSRLSGRSLDAQYNRRSLPFTSLISNNDESAVDSSTTKYERRRTATPFPTYDSRTSRSYTSTGSMGNLSLSGVARKLQRRQDALRESSGSPNESSDLNTFQPINGAGVQPISSVDVQRISSVGERRSSGHGVRHYFRTLFMKKRDRLKSLPVLPEEIDPSLMRTCDDNRLNDEKDSRNNNTQISVSEVSDVTTSVSEVNDVTLVEKEQVFHNIVRSDEIVVIRETKPGGDIGAVRLKTLDSSSEEVSLNSSSVKMNKNNHSDRSNQSVVSRRQLPPIPTTIKTIREQQQQQLVECNSYNEPVYANSIGLNPSFKKLKIDATLITSRNKDKSKPGSPKQSHKLISSKSHDELDPDDPLFDTHL